MCKDKEKCCQEVGNKHAHCHDNHENCCGGQGEHHHQHGHHHHDHHSCNCEQDHDHHETILLTTDDGEQINCRVLGTFDVEQKTYIAMLPEDGEDVFVYAFTEDGDSIQLDRIESDEEYEAVSTAFMALWGEDETE